ncbi:putative amino acid transporter, putative,amino acid permease [Trypanosoma grayi]|uniref:putative amino acid transporter, putative,amino acid permease n=1 Tax=Trypanosoma grayi TaxID=71804 RepID=UPI0004F45A08|nr:putative amino acid transporter, putative,amino acid permease [Trypanosoma grayi]KEG11412.1 putative amino acid transporter, putative,amino acid permease [Trypanosoma grayi]
MQPTPLNGSGSITVDGELRSDVESYLRLTPIKPSDVINPPTTSFVHQKQPKGIIGFITLILCTVIPHGGVLSNSFNLASASLGAGIITLPWAFRATGVLVGTVYLILMTIFTVYTVTIIGYVMQKTGFRAFEQMSRGVLGRGADYFMALVMGVSCFGAALAYVIATGSLITPILQRSPGIPEFLRTETGIRVMTCVVWFFGMLTLVIPKKINTLRYFSAVGVGFVVYFAITVVIHSCRNGLPKRSEVKLVTKGNSAIEGLGVFVFSYLCHAVAYQVYYEMHVPSVSSLLLCTSLSMTACSVLYWLAGFFGYMEFGDSIEESVLYMFDPVDEPMMMVAYIGLIIKLCVSYALNMIPCRNTVYYALGWDLDQLPYWKHIAVVTLISVIVLVCGLFVPRISTALNLAGAVCGGFIGFIYPVYFYMYSGGWTPANVGWFHYVMTYLTLIVGVVSVVFGTGATIYSTFN